ncbi:unnamed protein product [Trichogramma brassicae]|uniref:Uncharacterized protein n=1 Tax=Trichogramma brassicae TaxID=86971 RepID=A0A6H5IZL7_9HYME|nr:unnamed protein product [Trichogramma brassicae]
METFAEAWVAANTKNDQVQYTDMYRRERAQPQVREGSLQQKKKYSQALALTHKSSSSPSRTSSEPSLPRTPPPAAITPQPQSLTTSGSPPQTTTATTTAASSTVAAAASSGTNANSSGTAGANESSSSSSSKQQQRDSSRERSASIVSVTPAHQPQHQLVGSDSQRELSSAAAVHRQPYAAHNQHLKQELASSPKQEGFDLSKTSSSTERKTKKRSKLYTRKGSKRLKTNGHKVSAPTRVRYQRLNHTAGAEESFFEKRATGEDLCCLRSLAADRRYTVR